MMLRCPKEQHRQLRITSSVPSGDEEGLVYLITVECGVCGAFSQMAATADKWVDGIRNMQRGRLQQSQNSAVFNRVVGVHRATEARARVEARKLKTKLVNGGKTLLAKDDAFLDAYWNLVGVSHDHKELATRILRETLSLG